MQATQEARGDTKTTITLSIGFSFLSQKLVNVWGKSNRRFILKGKKKRKEFDHWYGMRIILQIPGNIRID